MPLKRYGVLRAAVVDRRVGTADTPHYQIHLRAAGTDHRVAVGVRSPQSPPELLYLGVHDFRHPILDRVAALPDGFTELDSRPGGTAVDYIRGNLFDRRSMRPAPAAAPGPDNDLGDFLDHYVRRALGDLDARAFVFGEAWGPEPRADRVFGFRPASGIRAVHMNQGDDAGFAGDDGVWQDGALLLHFPAAGEWVAVFLASASRAWHTDDITGHRLSGVSEPDQRVRIVAALAGETVTLLNPSPGEIDLAGWSLVDRAGDRQPLTGRLAAGTAERVPARLAAGGGTITLLDARGLKVDGVAYTAEQGRRAGWTVVF